jgi:hypothetical protein
MVNCGSYPEVYEHNNKKYNQIKEELCFSFLRPICAFIGASLERKARPMDNVGIDATIELPPSSDRPIVYRLDVQLKATSSIKITQDEKHLLFNLDIKICERMAAPKKTTPWLLLILLLPECVNEWVVIDNEKITLERTMFWYKVSEQDVNPKSKTVQLKIPVINKVTENSLYQLLTEQSEGE